MSYKSTYDIIVKNLSSQITENDLSKLFSTYGTIIGMSIKDSKMDNKKFAFVRFGTQEAAENALTNCNNIILNSNRIFVARADKKNSARNENNNSIFQMQSIGAGDTDILANKNLVSQYKNDNRINSGILEEKFIMITYVETSCLIYAQDEIDIKESTALDLNISHIAENLPQLLGAPEANKIYVTKFSLDGIWYRCKIYDLINKNEVEVIYCDYGNREIVKTSELFVLPDMFSDIKPFAKSYKLFGLKLIEAQSIKTQALEYMEAYQNKILKALVHPQTSCDPASITIFSETGLEINKEILKLGLALPQTSIEVNSPREINCGRPIIKSEKNESLVNENRAYAQQLKMLIEEKQELESKIDRLNKITFSKKMEMVQVTAGKINKLRKVFSTDNNVEDIIDAAIVTESSTSDLKLKDETIEKINKLMNELEVMQKFIGTWKEFLPEKQAMADAIVERNEKREELKKVLIEYVDWLNAQPINQYSELIQHVWSELNQSFLAYIKEIENVDEMEESLENAINAYKTWKESKISEYKLIRMLTDASKQSFMDAMSDSLKIFRDDLFDDFEIPDVDGLLTNYRNSMDAELNKSDEKTADEIEIEKNLVQILAMRIISKRKEISSLLKDKTCYSDLLNTFTIGQSNLPDHSDWEEISKNLRTYKSKLRHLLADKQDAEEEQRHDDISEINTQIDDVRAQLHKEFDREDSLISNLANLAKFHFPELIVQCPDIPLLNSINYNGLVKIGRSLTHFKLEPVDDRRTVFKSHSLDSQIIIKECCVDSKEAIICKLMEYNNLNPGQIMQSFFDMDGKMCYIIFPGDVSMEIIRSF